MSIYAEIQKLEPGEWIELFELDATIIGGDVLRFHGYTRVGAIWWQGEEYSPWPIQVEGFAKLSDGQQPTPTLKVGDIDGSITALCLFLQGLAGARLTRRQTLGKYLDAANFPEGNPEADPTAELPPSCGSSSSPKSSGPSNSSRSRCPARWTLATRSSPAARSLPTYAGGSAEAATVAPSAAIRAAPCSTATTTRWPIRRSTSAAADCRRARRGSAPIILCRSARFRRRTSSGHDDGT